MEGTHRELRARLTDRLGSDDTCSFSQFNLRPGRQIAAVAVDANSVFAFASQHRTYFDAFHSGTLNLPRFDLIDLVIGAHEQFLGILGVGNIVAGMPADQPFAQPDDFVFAFINGLHPDAVARTAVILADDYVLGHIHQLAGHVTRVGGLERRVGQTLAGAVSRDEVF